jgi:CelD/BcsL family acetyltransferase involved in cellulose biosynthesis
MTEGPPRGIVAGQASTAVLHGLTALEPWIPELTRLAQDEGAPLTAGVPWLTAWARAHPSWQPLSVLRVASDGRLVASALLATRFRGPVRQIVALGYGQSDYARFLGSAEEAEGLAIALAGLLDGFRSPWLLRLDQFPAADRGLTELAGRLSAVTLGPGDASPMIELAGFDPARDVSKSARQSGRTGRNRAAADGLELTIDRARDPEQIRGLLPALEELHASRDRALGRRSDLEKPEPLAFWRLLLPEAAGRGEVEVVVLRLAGRPVCHLIALLDGPFYRVWDFRIAPGSERYNPGHVLRDDVLRGVVADPRWEAVDWMRGEEPYKKASSTTVVSSSSLHAWSSPGLRRLERLARTTLDSWAHRRDT